MAVVTAVCPSVFIAFVKVAAVLLVEEAAASAGAEVETLGAVPAALLLLVEAALLELNVVASP